MVTGEGRVKILDFGLAKLVEPLHSDPEAPTVTARPLTQDGAVVGTAVYMSPEQAEGRKLDARSDIFSFGSVLYEMVTGQRPFTGDTRLAAVSKIVNEDPKPLRELAPSIPPDPEKTIQRCLRKDLDRRYQHMGDVRVALQDVQEESASSGQQAPTTAARAPLWRRWALAAVLPVALAVGIFAGRRWREPARSEPPRAVPLTATRGAELYPTLSPDGNQVAFSWAGPQESNWDIYVQMIGASSPLRTRA